MIPRLVHNTSRYNIEENNNNNLKNVPYQMRWNSNSHLHNSWFSLIEYNIMLEL